MDRKLQRHRADSLRQHGFLVLYLLAAFVFYGWPALRTFGFSVLQPGTVTAGVLNWHDCRVPVTF